MKAFVELTADDFPGVDPELFEEWKQARLRLRRNWIGFFVVLAIVNLVSISAFQTVVVGAGILPMAIMLSLNWKPARTARTLAAQLDLNPRRIHLAREGLRPAA